VSRAFGQLQVFIASVFVVGFRCSLNRFGRRPFAGSRFRDSFSGILMVDGKESLMVVGIVVGFLLIFALFVWFPGVVMHDGLSHQLDNGDDAVIFNKDGSLKESFWSMGTIRDLWNQPDELRRKAMRCKPEPNQLDELQANPLTE